MTLFRNAFPNIAIAEIIHFLEQFATTDYLKLIAIAAFRDWLKTQSNWGASSIGTKNRVKDLNSCDNDKKAVVLVFPVSLV